MSAHPEGAESVASSGDVHAAPAAAAAPATLRHALVVGVSGVAAATATLLAASGAVDAISLLFHTRGDEAAALAASLPKHLRVATYACDVTADAEVRSAFAAAVAAAGPLLYVVNCAGTTVKIPYADLEACSDDVWQRLYGTNVVGAFHVCRAAAGCMVAPPAPPAGGGGGAAAPLSSRAHPAPASAAIINISSVAAKLAQGSSLPYACSKAALDALTVGMARTLAPRGIRVLGVAPGFIAGGWLEGLLKDEYEGTKAAFEAALPLGRVCSPESVAEVVVSLCTSASMMTGQTVTVDGGMCIQGFTATL